ncbi:MAG: lamin tail domain-containing protein [Thermoplasmata archaeon]|nr:lamin tail domain-containing protein [Thermoplasmata archaeon]
MMRGWAIITVIVAIFLLYPSNAIFSSDLSLKWVKTDREVAIEGEIVEIRARVENLAENSTPFAVSFYLDVTDAEHLIARVTYASISHYRIPSIKWDTSGVEAGEHVIIAHVSDEREENNYARCNITILKAWKGSDLLITEVYYHARPHRNNEYIAITNVGARSINLEGYYLTTTPWKRVDEQNKVIFPFCILGPGESVYVTQNGSSFQFETGFAPDYEYYDCSSIPDMIREGRFVMANDGGVVCIKDAYNHTIDVVVYGNAFFHEGWMGEAIHPVGEGVVMKRNGWEDTNTSYEWEYNRTYVIGQSSFGVWHGRVDGCIAFCSPDCSYKVISSEMEKADEICINLYTFTNPFIAEILEGSNASIKMLLDGNVIGGIPMEERWIAWRLSQRGNVGYMMGDEERGIYKRYRYNHAKYVIYGERCIVESANWGMGGVPVDTSYGNREWGIVLEGENLSDFLWKVFDYDFNFSFQDIVAFNASNFTHGMPPGDFSPSHFIPHGDYVKRFDPLYINESFNATLILSPDNAEEEILNLLEKAEREILVEQLYIDKDWSGGMNPFLRKLIEKNESGVAVYVILNNNPWYTTSIMNGETAKFLRERGIRVRLQKNINIHNKGVVVDGKYVLISSINWGENSVRCNREAGIIVENPDVAGYFENIFWYDWEYERTQKSGNDFSIVIIFAATFLIIYLYRRR